MIACACLGSSHRSGSCDARVRARRAGAARAPSRATCAPAPARLRSGRYGPALRHAWHCSPNVKGAPSAGVARGVGRLEVGGSVDAALLLGEVFGAPRARRRALAALLLHGATARGSSRAWRSISSCRWLRRGSVSGLKASQITAAVGSSRRPAVEHAAAGAPVDADHPHAVGREERPAASSGRAFPRRIA